MRSNQVRRSRAGALLRAGRRHLTKPRGDESPLVASATGANARRATVCTIMLDDQDQVVLRGAGVSGDQDHLPTSNGNCAMGTRIRGSQRSAALNPRFPRGNRPVFHGIQEMNNITDANCVKWTAIGACGRTRAYRDSADPDAQTRGAYVHGQSNGCGWTHGCLGCGRDARFVNSSWNPPPQPVPVVADVPVAVP